MSKDTIYREDAIKALGESLYLDEIERAIYDLPSADRPQAEWIGEADGYADGEFVYDTWYCSNCDYAVDDDEPPTWHFCPSCGARMKGADDGRNAD